MSKNLNMTAGFFLGDRKIELRQTPVPQPSAGEVLLKVLGCGVCGTDYHIFEGEFTEGVYPPIVLGHEIAGRLEALGEGVTGLKVGQFCAVDPVVGCGKCEYCLQGEPNHCPAPTVIGYKRNGGFAQYCTAPAGKVILMDESVGVAGGVLCETLACVLRGYDRLGLRAGASVLVLGAGTVGLLWAQMLAHSPCGVLLQTELSDYRRGIAQKLGAKVVIDPTGNLERVIRHRLPGGVDFLIDATGDPAAIQQALPLLAKQGTLMPFGCCPAGSKLVVDPSEIFSKELRIIGSKMPPGTLHRAARIIEAGHIDCERIVTATLGLGQLAESVAGFNGFRSHQVKVAIDPWA